MRLVIILRAALVDAANTAIAERTGNPADAQTFTNPVLRNGNPVAYWCGWDFAHRSYTAAQVAAKLQQTLGLTDDEVLTRQDVTGQAPNLSTVRMVAFDADRVSPQQVLDYLDLTLPDPPTRPTVDDPAYQPVQLPA